jgi:type I restriction enzyme S subunit
MTLEYLYGLLTDETFRQHCRRHTTGTTVLHLAGDAIPTYLAPVASHESQEAYAYFASPLIEKVDSLNREIEHLASLRDVLLGELLSGRIRVPEADKAVEEVVA